MSMRMWCRLVLCAAAAGSLGAWPAAGGASTGVPNPCTILPGSAVSAAVGLKGVALTGKRSTRPDGRVKQTLCTYTRAGAKLEILVAPHQPSGGSGGAPGMVSTKPSGLGAGASFAYDLDPKFTFASVSFTKGAIDGGVWDNGKFPRGDILALARLVYKALP